MPAGSWSDKPISGVRMKNLGYGCFIFLAMGCSKIANNQVAFKKDITQPVVCDPFGGGNGGSDQIPIHGLLGELSYLEDDQPRYYTASEIVSHGRKMEVPLLLSNLNFPTRDFSSGFSLANGTPLKKDNGEVLIEWFAINMKSQFQLTPQQPEGLYELAVLSDDGSVIEIDQDGLTNTIDNDSVHPTQMGCSSMPVRLQRNTKVPFRIRYFQGPRIQIALVLIMRPWSPTADPLCGIYGNYFGPSKPSDPASAGYQALLSRGWQTTTTENFLLPEGHNSTCN